MADTDAEQARRYLIRRPRALQYFHNGTLKRVGNEGEERQSGRFELFLDLLYVALVANFAEDLSDEPNGAQFVKYILIFAPAWHAWGDIKELSNSYYNDDLLQRALILWVMALLVIYGNNAILVDKSISAMRTTVAAYMLTRLTTVGTYVMNSLGSHFHRRQNRVYAILTIMCQCIWIPLYIDGISLRAKVAVAAVAIAFEEMVWVFSFGPFIKRMLKLEFSTAVDVPHEIDRAGAFYTIILGEYLYSIVVGSNAAIGLNLRAMRAIWTLVIAFVLNWLYTNNDGSLDSVHPLRRSVLTAFLWIMFHLPLAASLLIGGHISALTTRTDELESGQRWLFGGGLGVGLLALLIIAICFKSEDRPGTLIFSKPVRLAARFCVAIILILLPLSSPESIDASRLVSIAAALFVFVLIWETVGSLEKGACMFESWSPPPTAMDEHNELEAQKSLVSATETKA